jgi:hypothetical protein
MYHRKPRTTQERRANGPRCQWVWHDEYRVKYRARRSMCMLVEAWDDLPRSDYNFRSWKRHRRTQYKS